MRGRRVVPILAGLAAVALYVVLGLLTFKPPANLAEAQQCGFSMADFTAQGQFATPRVPAVLRRFVTQKDYYTALSLGVVMGFLVHSLYQAGAGRFANLGLGLVGGSVLATLIVCTGCVIPLLAAAFFGVAFNVFLPIPREMMLVLAIGFVVVGSRWAKRKGAAFAQVHTGAAGAAAVASATQGSRGRGGLLALFSSNHAHPDPALVRRHLVTALEALARGSEVPFRHGRELLAELGYPDEALATLPAEATVRFAGLGNPHRAELLRPGMAVLDAGLSGGVDALLAARAVGPTGRVVRLDPVASLGPSTGSAPSITAATGQLEQLPFADASFDAVLVNGALTPCTDRARALTELHRVLRPDGVLLLCDLQATRKLMLRTKHDFTRWVALLGGAVTASFLVGRLEEAGFTGVVTLGQHGYFHDAPDPAIRAIAEQHGVQAVELAARKAGPRSPTGH